MKNGVNFHFCKSPCISNYTERWLPVSVWLTWACNISTCGVTPHESLGQNIVSMWRCRTNILLIIISKSLVTSKNPFTLLLSQHNTRNVTLSSRGQENAVEMTSGKQSLSFFDTQSISLGAMNSILMDFSSCVCRWLYSSILWKIISYFCVVHQTAEADSPWNSFLCLQVHPCVYKYLRDRKKSHHWKDLANISIFFI